MLSINKNNALQHSRRSSRAARKNKHTPRRVLQLPCAMESAVEGKSFFIFLFINPARVITEKDEEETIMIVIIRPTAEAAAALAAVEFE
jgi:hypothetical protein